MGKPLCWVCWEGEDAELEGATSVIDYELSRALYQVGLVLDTGRHCSMRCSGPTDEVEIWLDTKIKKKKSKLWNSYEQVTSEQESLIEILS